MSHVVPYVMSRNTQTDDNRFDEIKTAIRSEFPTAPVEQIDDSTTTARVVIPLPNDSEQAEDKKRKLADALREVDARAEHFDDTFTPIGSSLHVRVPVMCEHAAEAECARAESAAIAAAENDPRKWTRR